jgi:transcription elongation factor SPT5
MSPDYSRESGRHRLLDLQREGEKERSARDLAQELDERYKRSVKYQGDSNIGPSKANMPTPFDPKLWRISCKGGKERDIIRTILQKSFAMEQMGEDLGITAAFQRDTIRETIYVEARQPQDVQKALTGIAGVYLNSRPRAGPVIPGRDHVGKGPMIVPRDDMVPLLTMKKKEVEAKEGMWVRVKRGKYAGDLAQISEVVQDGLTAVVLLVPRIDYNPNDRIEDRKRKKAGLQNGPASTVRPPARLFNIEDVQNAYGKGTVSRRAGQYMFQNEDYNADGLLEKEYPLASLELENVKPTLDEISLFPKAGEGEGTGITVNLEAIREDTRKTTAQNIQPGDHVEVMEGEQSGIKGVVETVRGETVTIRAPPMTLGEKDAVLEIPVAAVQKTFKEGDHVKVMTGKNAGETGLVLDSNADTGIVAIWSDLGERKVRKLISGNIRSSEVTSGSIPLNRLRCLPEIFVRLRKSAAERTESATMSCMISS